MDFYIAINGYEYGQGFATFHEVESYPHKLHNGMHCKSLEKQTELNKPVELGFCKPNYNSDDVAAYRVSKKDFKDIKSKVEAYSKSKDLLLEEQNWQGQYISDFVEELLSILNAERNNG